MRAAEMTDHSSPERNRHEACGGDVPRSIYERIFEFIDTHQGCLTREITAHIGRSVRKQLDEMDRASLIVRVTKYDRYACDDGREKRHYTADQHLGHIGRYGVNM